MATLEFSKVGDFYQVDFTANADYAFYRYCIRMPIKND